ncbi:MAG: spermidine synthase [Planctomycetes bacterium]|nr:spermidine synthase [Planctomycetota bacterium]
MTDESKPSKQADILAEFREDVQQMRSQIRELSHGSSAGAGGSDKPPARRSGVSDFWALVGCNAIVFGTSVCIMVLELTASRLIAPYVGSSLYTWTSVIGVVLAGISLGNYLGGWLADRYQPQKVLAWLFLASGLLTFSVLVLNGWAAETARPESTSWPVWVMCVVAWVFFLPALSLGTISPVTASMALKRSVKTGITVGNIYAWGALGSIVGTFLTGFWLIGEFGSREVICVTSCALLTMGVLVAAGQKAFRAAAVFGAIPLVTLFGTIASTTESGMEQFTRFCAGARSGWSTSAAKFAADEQALAEAVARNDATEIAAIEARQAWRTERATAERSSAAWGAKLGRQLHAVGLTLGLRSDKANEYNDESNYYSINISNTYEEGDTVKQLRLDYLTHSYYNPSNPTKLYYTYEKVYAAITERSTMYWSRPNVVNVAELPGGDKLNSSFPGKLRYDGDTHQLSARGVLGLEDLRDLLKIGPYADYWLAVISAWDQAANGWNNQGRPGRSELQTPLDVFPADVQIPVELERIVRYDSDQRALVTRQVFDLDHLWQLLSLGKHADYISAVRTLFENSRRTSTLFIGGGGFVFPRWIEAAFPFEPRIDVAEIDPAVLLAVESELGLPNEFGSPTEGKTQVRTHIADARLYVDERLAENRKLVAAGQAPITYDFVYGDAFNDLSVPWHLTTLEFSTKVRDLLTPGQGVFLVNIIDIYPRVEYPSEKDKLGEAEAILSVPLPASLMPQGQLTDQFVPCRGGITGLEVRQLESGLVLRYRGVMSRAVHDALIQLQPADKTLPIERLGFSRTVRRLFERSNERRLLEGEPPAAVVPKQWGADGWEKAPAPYAGLQLQRVAGGGYTVAYRGVMSAQTRDKLLNEPGASDGFKSAIQSLYTRTQAGKVGQFLGRYVATARQIFPHVYIFASDEGEPGDSRDTFIIACSLQKMSFEDLDSSGHHWSTGPFAWTETNVSGERADLGEMPVVLEHSRGRLLTDNFAPVDNLLAPVFVSRSED